MYLIVNKTTSQSVMITTAANVVLGADHYYEVHCNGGVGRVLSKPVGESLTLSDALMRDLVQEKLTRLRNEHGGA